MWGLPAKASDPGLLISRVLNYTSGAQPLPLPMVLSKMQTLQGSNINTKIVSAFYCFWLQKKVERLTKQESGNITFKV